MCDIKHGHDYDKDAELEMEDGAGKWETLLEAVKAFRWILIPLLIWVGRVEYRIGPSGFTDEEAKAMEDRINAKIEALPPDLYEQQQNERYETMTHALARIEEAVRLNGAAMLRHLENHR